MTIEEKHRVILGAFYNSRYGVSPSATRGAVEGHARKNLLFGAEFKEALESAIRTGLVAQMSDASLSIRQAGRQLLPKR